MSRIQCCSGRSPFSLKKGSDAICFSMPDRDPSTHGVDLLCRPRSTPTNSRTTMRRDLSKAGWVRLRGCPRHGCRAQAPLDGFTASPAAGPTPPSHVIRLLPLSLPWLLRVPGAARPTTPQSCSRWYVATSSQPISRAWRARRSARNTERCLPPVQPKATVT